MRRWLIVFALLCLPIAALAGLTSRDSTYDNACAIMGTCTGGGGGASPIIFQHIATSTNPIGNGITGRTPIIHVESLPANTVAVVAVTVPVAATTPTISDTLAGSWAASLCTATGGTGNYKTSIFVQSLGATGGADTVTISFGSTNRQPFQYVMTFWQNINTTTPANGSSCSASGGLVANSGGLLTPASFTPTTNNDANGGNVIWTNYALCGAAASNASMWTPAAGFNLLNGEIIWITTQGFPEATQYEVQATRGAVTPSITATGENASGDCFNEVTAALMVANNSASPPSAIHVASVTHESFATFTSPGTMKVQWPTYGNLRVMALPWGDDSPGLGTGHVTAITASDGCTFTQAANTGVSGAAGIWYAQNCSPCQNCTYNLTWTGSQALPQASFREYDIENAIASSYQNSVGGTGACGTTVTNAPSFTPTGATSGLAIQTMENGNGPVTATTSPTGAMFDLWLFTGITDSDLGDNADTANHYYYSSLAAQSWNFTKTHGSDNCNWAAAAFN